MLPAKQKPAIVRVSRFSLPQKPKRLLIHSKSVNCPVVHVKVGNQSINANRSSTNSSTPLRTRSLSTSSASLKDTEIDTVKDERCLTVYCCYVTITCTIGWLLLLAAIMALAFILTEPHITTTTTSTTTTSDTTTTATTTTTVTGGSCSAPTWNQTGLLVAGKSSGAAGSTSDTFKNSACVYVDDNYTIYVCDHHNERVQKWFQNATVGNTIAGTSAGSGATDVGHVEYLTMDKLGNIYVAGHTQSTVLRFAPGSIVGTVAAGSVNGQLKESSDVAIDDDLNLYVADPKNQRIMKWTQNSTSGTAVITNSNLGGIYGILLVPNSTNQIYLSSKDNNAIYLWTFGSSTPDLILTTVNSTNQPTLKGPLGMALDNNGSLYVADKDNNRIVMFLADSTIGEPILGECNVEPLITAPMDVAIDNNQDLYVVLDGNQVLKYTQ